MGGGRRVVAGVLLVAGLVSACGDDGGQRDSSGGVLAVPGDYATIQQAVDAAGPGDLVLISPGTYEEEVDVTTEDLVIRGLDREEVVLDGGFELENGIRVLEADGVAVENLTVRGYTGNGVFWTGVEGFRGSYLTAVQNGLYGIYAYGSAHGTIEDSYVAGNPDSGVYIGQCGDCDAVVQRVVGEWNGFGYSGVNSTNVTVVDSTWRHNRTGLVVAVGTYEGCGPSFDNHIVGNLASDNGNLDAPAAEAPAAAGGTGILLSGAREAEVSRNRTDANPIAGIGVIPRPEGDPVTPILEERPDPDCREAPVPSDADLPHQVVWFSVDNQVTGNVATGNRWDLTLIEGPEYGNCFSDNDATTSNPADVQRVAPCTGEQAATFDLRTTTFLDALDAQAGRPVDYRSLELPDPGPLESMPDAATAPARPAEDPEPVDLAAVEVPPPA